MQKPIQRCSESDYSLVHKCLDYKLTANEYREVERMLGILRENPWRHLSGEERETFQVILDASSARGATTTVVNTGPLPKLPPGRV